jgi:hypothetical protein
MKLAIAASNANISNKDMLVQEDLHFLSEELVSECSKLRKFDFEENIFYRDLFYAAKSLFHCIRFIIGKNFKCFFIEEELQCAIYLACKISDKKITNEILQFTHN